MHAGVLALQRIEQTFRLRLGHLAFLGGLRVGGFLLLRRGLRGLIVLRLDVAREFPLRLIRRRLGLPGLLAVLRRLPVLRLALLLRLVRAVAVVVLLLALLALLFLLVALLSILPAMCDAAMWLDG